MPSTSAPLLCQRDLFSIPDGHCYLNSAFMGPLPRLVEQAGAAALAARASPMGLTAQDFFEPAERVRILCAQLVDADPYRVPFFPTLAYPTPTVPPHPPPNSRHHLLPLA